MSLAGANPRAKVSGLEELPGKSNYFIGNDPKKWRTNVATYARVKYEGVYPGGPGLLRMMSFSRRMKRGHGTVDGACRAALKSVLAHFRCKLDRFDMLSP